jgi:hypothetical protein
LDEIIELRIRIRDALKRLDGAYVQSDFRKKYTILQKKRDIHLKTWYLKM